MQHYAQQLYWADDRLVLFLQRIHVRLAIIRISLILNNILSIEFRCEHGPFGNGVATAGVCGLTSLIQPPQTAKLSRGGRIYSGGSLGMHIDFRTWFVLHCLKNAVQTNPCALWMALNGRCVTSLLYPMSFQRSRIIRLAFTKCERQLYGERVCWPAGSQIVAPGAHPRIEIMLRMHSVLILFAES